MNLSPAYPFEILIGAKRWLVVGPVPGRDDKVLARRWIQTRQAWSGTDTWVSATVVQNATRPGADQ